ERGDDRLAHRGVRAPLHLAGEQDGLPALRDLARDPFADALAVALGLLGQSLRGADGELAMIVGEHDRHAVGGDDLGEVGCRAPTSWSFQTTGATATASAVRPSVRGIATVAACSGVRRVSTCASSAPCGPSVQRVSAGTLCATYVTYPSLRRLRITPIASARASLARYAMRAVQKSASRRRVTPD